MASPHVPVSPALRLPEEYEHVPGYLANHDAELRIRWSLDRKGWFVIERRCRRRSPVHCGRPDGGDLHVQARDGYIHVATGHPSWLLRPWNIVHALKREGADVFAEGAKRIADDLDYEDKWRRESAKRRRREVFRAAAREMVTIGARLGAKEGRTERTRFSNPGLPKPVARRARRGRRRLVS